MCTKNDCGFHCDVADEVVDVMCTSDSPNKLTTELAFGLISHMYRSCENFSYERFLDIADGRRILWPNIESYFMSLTA